MPLSLLPSLLLTILFVGYTPGPANLFSLHCSVRNGMRKSLVMWLGLFGKVTHFSYEKREILHIS